MPSLGVTALIRDLVVPKQPPRMSRERYRKTAIDLIEREKLVEPAFSFNIVDLDAPAADTLHVAGERLFAPRLIPETGTLTALACGVVTIGPRLEQQVSLLFKQRAVSLALALDQIGNELLLAAVRRLQDRMMIAARRRGLLMAGELRPGDPGLGLDAQGAILRLAGAESIGISLTRGHAICPLKSSSMVLGVGIDLPPSHWSRCDDCRSRATCKVAERDREMTAN
jgi:hypothetical protein